MTLITSLAPGRVLMEKFAYWDSDVDFCCIHCGEFNSTREGIVHDGNRPMLPEPPEAENE